MLLLHTSIHALSHKCCFTPANTHTHKPLHTYLYTHAFTFRLFHTGCCTHAVYICFYTGTLTHTEHWYACACTQALLHTHAFTQTLSYPHVAPVVRRSFYIHPIKYPWCYGISQYPHKMRRVQVDHRWSTGFTVNPCRSHSLDGFPSILKPTKSMILVHMHSYAISWYYTSLNNIFFWPVHHFSHPPAFNGSMSSLAKSSLATMPHCLGNKNPFRFGWIKLNLIPQKNELHSIGLLNTKKYVRKKKTAKN